MPFIYLFQKNTSAEFITSHWITNNNKQNPYKNWSDRKNETTGKKYQRLLIPPTPSKIKKFALKHKYGRTEILLEFLCWSLISWVQHFRGKTTHLCLAFPTAVLPRKTPHAAPRTRNILHCWAWNVPNQPFMPHEISWKAANQPPSSPSTVDTIWGPSTKGKSLRLL